MKTKADIKKIYKISENVVARDLHGEFVIIPITSGVGDLEDEIFSLNETGRAIWEKLDGKLGLKKVAEHLAREFDATQESLEKDCLGLVEELLKRKMLIAVKK